MIILIMLGAMITLIVAIGLPCDVELGKYSRAN